VAKCFSPNYVLQSSFYVFNTEMANTAAIMVVNGSVQSIIHHHTNFQAHCRLHPSKVLSHVSSQQNTVKTELNSPHSALTSSASAPPTGKPDVKPYSQSVPSSSTSTEAVTSENPAPTQATGPQVKIETKPSNAVNRVKGEPDVDPTRSSSGANPSPSTEVVSSRRFNVVVQAAASSVQHCKIWSVQVLNSSYTQSIRVDHSSIYLVNAHLFVKVPRPGDS